ncbi:MAG: phosphoribosyltransferase family protein [Candidatus Paceibacterota bacterium]|jgi:orotate phosphoribosyltransferase
MFRNSTGWIDIYQRKKALWVHDGNFHRPHALLASGKHSNGFFNSRLVIPDEGLLRAAASDLLEKFDEHFEISFDVIHCVAGPQTGATKLADFLSQRIPVYTMEDCFFVSPAKNETGGEKSMVFSDEEARLLPGRSVLLCEDVLTTGGSIDRTETAVIVAGGIVMPFILTLVNRSGLKEVSGKRIISLIDYHMPQWTPAECPLCKKGSKAIPAKDNWELLNAEYPS